MTIRLPASQVSSMYGPVPFSLRRMLLSAMWAFSQSSSWMAFEANAILARNATSAWHRSNSTVRRSTALIRLNSLVFLVASPHGASASAGHDLALKAAALVPVVAPGPPVGGAFVAAGVHAAMTIAIPANRVAS